MSESYITKHPSHASGSIALLAVLCAVGLSTNHPLQRTIVAIEAVGMVILLGSSVAQQRGRRGSGLSLLLAGSVTVSIALGLGVVFPGRLIERGALIGGMLGPVLMILAVYPLRATWSRPLTWLGAALLISVLMIRGWVAQIGQTRLLGAVVMTVVAWDAAEQAITLGNDVGRSARTFVVSITHTIASLTVGIIAITITTGMYGITPATIPLVSVLLLLGSIPVFVLSLYIINIY